MPKTTHQLGGFLLLLLNTPWLFDRCNHNAAVLLAVATLFVDALFGFVANDADFVALNELFHDLGLDLDACNVRRTNSGRLAIDGQSLFRRRDTACRQAE